MRLSVAAVAFACGLATAPLAAQVLHPVIDAKGGYMLGASVNGTWRPAQDVARSIGEGRRYRVYGAAGPLGVASGTSPQLIGEPCDDAYEVKLAPAPHGPEIAVDATWNPLPRRVTRVGAPATAAYAGAVREIARQHGIANAEVRITGVVRADLDGDGTEEAVVFAFRRTASRTAHVGAGDYGMVFVRKLAGGSVRTILLDGEFFPRRRDDAAPDEFTVAGVWDLDGDGTLEIVTRASYYEGDWTTVYRIIGTRAVKLASAGCGA